MSRPSSPSSSPSLWFRDETVLVNNSRIAANTLEAVIGAVYLDSGLETCDAVTAGLFFPEAVSARVGQ